MSTKPSNPPSTLERDPVCGMNVIPPPPNIYLHARREELLLLLRAVRGKIKAGPGKYLTAMPPAKPSGLVTLGAAKPVAPPLLHETLLRKTSLHENIYPDQSAPAYVWPHVPGGP